MSRRMPDDIAEFRVEIGADAIAELRDRLVRTRWAEAETVDDWSQGLPLAYTQELCGYWADGYDFAAAEERLNAFPQFTTELSGDGDDASASTSSTRVRRTPTRSRS